MTTEPVTPPPASTPPQQPRRSTAGKTVAIVSIVIGSVLLLGTGTTAAIGAVANTQRDDQTLTADTAGVTDLDVDASAGSVTILFDDVDEASLEVRDNTRGPWTLERDGDTLQVTSRDGWFTWGWGGQTIATLTLPSELEGDLDADLHLSAGDLDAEGDFGELSVEVDAGDAHVRGQASTLDLEIDAGSADLDIDGAREVSVRVSAGRGVVALTGNAPDTVDIDVSAGSLDLTLPDDVYDVRADVSAGDVDNQLSTSTESNHTVTVSVSAGDVTLR